MQYLTVYVKPPCCHDNARYNFVTVKQNFPKDMRIDSLFTLLYAGVPSEDARGAVVKFIENVYPQGVLDNISAQELICMLLNE